MPALSTTLPANGIRATGVTMYLTKEAIAATLRQVAMLAPRSTLAMTFMLPIELLEPEDRRMLEWAQKAAAASGTRRTVPSSSIRSKTRHTSMSAGRKSA